MKNVTWCHLMVDNIFSRLKQAKEYNACIYAQLSRAQVEDRRDEQHRANFALEVEVGTGLSLCDM